MFVARFGFIGIALLGETFCIPGMGVGVGVKSSVTKEIVSPEISKIRSLSELISRSSGFELEGTFFISGRSSFIAFIIARM